jgi:hypothetical protein
VWVVSGPHEAEFVPDDQLAGAGLIVWALTRPFLVEYRPPISRLIMRPITTT